MIMIACSVYDRKVAAYMTPQFFRTKGEAIRAFIDAVANEGSPFSKHASDYMFCRLGEYDDNQGVFVNADGVPEVLLTGDDALIKAG